MSTRSATPGNLVTTGAGEAWYAEPREKRALTFQLLGVAGQQRHFRPEALTWRGNPATPQVLEDHKEVALRHDQLSCHSRVGISGVLLRRHRRLGRNT